MKIDREAAAAELEVRLQTDFTQPGMLRAETAVVRKGPKVYKTASILSFGDPSTGELKKRELRVHSYAARATGSGFEFGEPTNTWACEDDEIAKVQALLDQEFSRSGRYRLVSGAPEFETLLRQVTSGAVAAEAMLTLLAAVQGVAGLAEVVTGSPDAQLFAGLVDLHRQRKGLEALRATVDTASSTEADFQRILREHWRLFGGRYLGQADRRKITVLDEVDLPLLRTDGVLHVVELKRACIARLVIDHRNHVVTGPEVHLATSQAMSYLRSLDESRAIIKTELGIDCRRAFATIVIGHPQYVEGYSDDQVSEAIRTYNSHLTRLEVITYKDLIDGAERVLALDD